VTTFDVPTMFPAAYVAPTAIIGNPFRPLLDGREVRVGRATEIGAGVWIGHFTTVGLGVKIGAGSILEEYVAIQPLSEIGSRVVVTSRSRIGIGVTVGDDSVIRGHVGDRTRVGAGCLIAGELIHRQLDPSTPWDDPTADEPAPVIGNGAFVGWRALIVGGVDIGAGAYVCAGSLITRDVPAGYIAHGRNQVTHPDHWPGALGKSPFFRSARHSKKATWVGPPGTRALAYAVDGGARPALAPT
jgi:acetyltransferase-like isoleucine patch superfamily enzyme